MATSVTAERLGALRDLPLACVRVDRMGQVAEANLATADLLGVPWRRLEGRTLSSFLPAGSRGALNAALGQGEAGVVDLVIGKRAGEAVPARAHVAPLDDGAVVVFVDRRAENEAKQRGQRLGAAVDRLRAGASRGSEPLEPDIIHARLGRLLEEVSSGVITVDRSCHVRFANDVVVELLGEMVTGRRLPARFGDFEPGPFVEALFSFEAVSAEGRFRIGPRSFRIVGIPTTSELAVLLVWDETATARLEQAERDFVANAAHELQSPLAAMVSAVEVLHLGAKDDVQERERFLGHLSTEIRRMQRLVLALLELARAQHREQPPTTEPVPVHELLSEIAGGLNPAPGVRVDVVCPPELVITSHRQLLAHAVGNVAANAARYTREGWIRLSARPARATVIIEVTDTGPGIPEEHLANVLNRFYRADRTQPGAGLGLAIARQAVESLGGTIALAPGRTRGTRARITLPAGPP